MQRYLHPGDYSIQVRNEIATLLSEGQDNILAKAETARVSYLRGQFARRYDVDSIFRLMALFDASRIYTAPVLSPPELVFFKNTGETVDNYKVYAVAVTTAAGESPASTPTKWVEYNRNPFVVLKLVDLILYDLHSKYARRNMPQIVQDRYTDAIKWAEDVGDGKIDADLPAKTVTDASVAGDIRWNSYEVEGNIW